MWHRLSGHRVRILGIPLSNNGFHARNDDVDTDDHAGSTAIRRVVDAAMSSVAVLAEVPTLRIERAVADGATNHASSEKRGEELRKQGEDVETHAARGSLEPLDRHEVHDARVCIDKRNELFDEGNLEFAPLGARDRECIARRIRNESGHASDDDA